jgi:NAD(P)H-flavin reductase/ferredoxin
MPELRVAGRQIQVSPGANLLDALLENAQVLPYSCRAGSCHACMLRCIEGEPDDALPDALSPQQRAAGWRLACQCRIQGDLSVQLFDPARDAQAAEVTACDWLSPTVLRLRLRPERPLRYRAGQHLQLWASATVARPYSLASLAHEDPWLEFHLDCSRAGAFCDLARQLRPGDSLQLGALHGGALHYDPEWHDIPLLLMAAGSGLAPLWAVLREALRQGHAGPVQLLHLAREPAEHYLATALAELQQRCPQVQVELLVPAQLDTALAQLRLVSRQTRALLCGDPGSLEAFARRLYLAGLKRGQMFADSFLPHA